jgi:hypothetical protein
LKGVDLTITTVILLLLGVAVLLFGIFGIARGQSSIGSALGESDWLSCCSNFCASGSVDATWCPVSKQVKPDGRATLREICDSLGKIDADDESCKVDSSPLCSCKK